MFDGRVPPPDFVNIETTKFCNLRCRMCVQFNDGTTVAGPHMEIAEFERIAAEVFPFVSRWQPSVGGEPTMSREFERMLELAGAFGVKAEMFSNGTLLSDKMIERLAPNIGAMTISFDGASKETFEFIREGAGYDDVLARIEKLIAHTRRTVPAHLQPEFGINCTLMERNIRELPDLVRLAARLGVGHVSCYHVFPVTPEMKRGSLVHHRELARRCLDEAFAVARQLGMALRVEALDQITATTAMDPNEPRAWSLRDGVVEGLEAREVGSPNRRGWPGLDPADPQTAVIERRRAAARAATTFPPSRPRGAAPDAGTSAGEIWWCEFLWDKTYVTIGGDVRPCCVAGMPVVGNLHRESFPALWNNANYRAMRQGLVARQPVPACRGCMHIRTLTDPVEIDRLLLGQRPPQPHELPPLPAPLDPRRAAAQRAGEPPVLEWPADPEARWYDVQFSLDDFGSILFATSGPMGGPVVRENRYAVPKWAWRDAPVDRAIQYRVVAKRANGDAVIASGSMPAEPRR